MRKVPTLEGNLCGWKFRGCSRETRHYNDTLSIFRNRTLWFSNPKELNDPFDSTHDLRELVKTVRASLRGNNIKLMSSCDMPGAHVHHSMDTNGECRILSLCGHVDNTLMWSHYADGHKGLALGFNFTDDEIFKYKYVDVSYDQTFSEFFTEAEMDHANYFDIKRSSQEKAESRASYMRNLNKIPHIRYRIKGKDWRYENERRFLIKKSDGDCAKGQAVPYSPKSLKYLVFGVLAEPKLKQEIRAILADSDWNHVEILETKPDLYEQNLIYTKYV